MNITYQKGKEEFKISQGDKTIFINSPLKQKSGNLYLYSLPNKDFAPEVFSEFTIDSAGEFEFKDIFIQAFQIDSKYNGKNVILNIFKILFEDINLVFLGPLSNLKDISPDILENILDADILFIPIGGDEVLENKEASKFALKLNVKIIIPMHFQDKKTLDNFSQDFSKKIEVKEKMSMKKKEIDALKPNNLLIIQ